MDNPQSKFGVLDLISQSEDLGFVMMAGMQTKMIMVTSIRVLVS